jgi:hypothetical protein
MCKLIFGIQTPKRKRSIPDSHPAPSVLAFFKNLPMSIPLYSTIRLLNYGTSQFCYYHNLSYFALRICEGRFLEHQIYIGPNNAPFGVKKSFGTSRVPGVQFGGMQNGLKSAIAHCYGAKLRSRKPGNGKW